MLKMETTLAIRMMIVLSVLVALISSRFIFFGFVLSFPDFAAQLDARWFTFVVHAVSSVGALVLGALQFVQGLQQRYPSWHRYIGWAYVLLVLVGGLSGLTLALHALGGIVAGIGFGLLSILWLVFVVQGVRTARAGHFEAHRRWMVRSFSLTFSAVTLRLYLAIFMIFGFQYPSVSLYLAWMSWVPNLLFAHWWLRRSANQSSMVVASNNRLSVDDRVVESTESHCSV